MTEEPRPDAFSDSVHLFDERAQRPKDLTPSVKRPLPPASREDEIEEEGEENHGVDLDPDVGVPVSEDVLH